MATEQTETGSEQGDDLNIDVNLDEFSLDDEQLFADLDNEVRLDTDKAASADSGANLDLEGDLDLGGEVDLGGADAASDVDLGGELDLGDDLDLGGDVDLGDAEPSAGPDSAAGASDTLDLDSELSLPDDLDPGAAKTPASAAAETDDLDLGDLQLDTELDLGSEDTAVETSDALDLGSDLDLGDVAAAPPEEPALEDAGAGADLDLDLDIEAAAEPPEESSIDASAGEIELPETDALAGEGTSASDEELEQEDLDELADVDLEPPEDPELTFDEDDLTLGDETLDLVPEEPEAEGEVDSEEGSVDDAFEAAPDIDLDDIDLEAIDLSAPPAGEGPAAVDGREPAGDAVEVDLSDEPQAEEPFEAVPDVDLDELNLDDLGHLEPAGLGLADPFTETPGENGISFEQASDVGEWGDRSGGDFVAAQDIDIQDKDVLELKLDDLESTTGGGADGGRAVGRFGDISPISAGEELSLPPQRESSQRQAYAVPQQDSAPRASGGLAVDSAVLMSIPRKINVEMGAVTLNGREIMDLSYGSVVQLDQVVGDPVELVLEGRPIAQGEIVLINGRNLGVRIVSLHK